MLGLLWAEHALNYFSSSAQNVFLHMQVQVQFCWKGQSYQKAVHRPITLKSANVVCRQGMKLGRQPAGYSDNYVAKHAACAEIISNLMEMLEAAQEVTRYTAAKVSLLEAWPYWSIYLAVCSRTLSSSAALYAVQESAEWHLDCSLLG